MMKSALALTVLTLATLAFGQAGNLQISTPAQVVTCQPALLSWSGGTAPYYLSILPGGQVSATAIEALPTQQGMTYSWTVNIAAQSYISLEIRDSTGLIQYSSPITVQAGPVTSCVQYSAPQGSAVSSVSQASSTAASMTSATGMSASATSATQTGAAGSSSPTVSGSAQTSTPTTTAKSGASAPFDFSFGALSFAGVAGLLGAALV